MKTISIPAPSAVIGGKVQTKKAARTISRSKNSHNLFAQWKISATFATHSILRQASQLANTAGIFYARNNTYKVSTPVWSVNAPTACLRWNATGKRNLSSFSRSVNFFNVSF